MPRQHILCIGEVLWDKLPSGMFLGGAPFNVACDLHQLGCRVTMLSRVGDDEPGRRVLDSMSERGMSTDQVQIDHSLPTGTVDVEIGGDAVPHFTINRPSAWDAIELPHEYADGPPAIVVFGSLAQRSEASRSTIERVCQTAQITIFDVNLRAPFDDREIVRHSLEHSTVLKLNRQEVVQLAGWFALPQEERRFSDAVASRFGCRTVCITRDAEGAALWHEGEWFEHPGFRVDVRDVVGAGDGFLAGFIAQSLHTQAWSEILDFANLLGAYIASRDGATPKFSEADLRAFHRLIPRRSNP